MIRFVNTILHFKIQPSVHFKDGIQIEFHRDPSLQYDISTSGWISRLEFNRLPYNHNETSKELFSDMDGLDWKTWNNILQNVL